MGLQVRCGRALLSSRNSFAHFPGRMVETLVSHSLKTQSCAFHSGTFPLVNCPFHILSVCSPGDLGWHFLHVSASEQNFPPQEDWLPVEFPPSLLLVLGLLGAGMVVPLASTRSPPANFRGATSKCEGCPVLGRRAWAEQVWNWEQLLGRHSLPSFRTSARETRIEAQRS